MEKAGSQAPPQSFCCEGTNLGYTTAKRTCVLLRTCLLLRRLFRTAAAASRTDIPAPPPGWLLLGSLLILANLLAWRRWRASEGHPQASLTEGSCIGCTRTVYRRNHPGHSRGPRSAASDSKIRKRYFLTVCSLGPTSWVSPPESNSCFTRWPMAANGLPMASCGLPLMADSRLLPQRTLATRSQSVYNIVRIPAGG